MKTQNELINDEISKQVPIFMREHFTNPTKQDEIIIQIAMRTGVMIAAQVEIDIINNLAKRVS